MSTGTQDFDEEFDLVIVGSGDGGMTAALAAAEEGLSVLVVEKAKKFGGSTGISGGGVWLPNNPTLRRRGHDDSRQSIHRYLDLLTAGRVPGEGPEAFIATGPTTLAMLD